MRQINLSHRHAFNSALVFVLCFLFSGGISQDLPPSPDRWVEDYADILTPSQERDLNQMLRTYEDTTSNQIMVAVFPDAQGYPVEEFSIRLAEKWLVGQKGRDNGIILAIFLKERKIRVEVGYGLEDMVPDAIAFQITDGVIPPYFREGKYYQGIQAGVRALMLAAAGKFEGVSRGNRTDGSPGFPFILLVVFLMILISMFRRRNFSGAGSRGWTSSGPFFWGGMGGGRSSGGGGGFGGGFRGGGGGFGGGGATGSW